MNAAVPNQELIDFEKYVLGVVYAENGGAPDEAMKAQAIAARTYAFNRGTIKEEMVRLSLKYQVVLGIKHIVILTKDVTYVLQH